MGDDIDTRIRRLLKELGESGVPAGASVEDTIVFKDFVEVSTEVFSGYESKVEAELRAAVMGVLLGLIACGIVSAKGGFFTHVTIFTEVIRLVMRNYVRDE